MEFKIIELENGYYKIFYKDTVTGWDGNPVDIEATLYERTSIEELQQKIDLSQERIDDINVEIARWQSAIEALEGFAATGKSGSTNETSWTKN